MSDNQFWAHVERVEADFLSDRDEPQFRRRMKRKGFPDDVIEERVQAVNEQWSMIYESPHHD